jgi:hypothetical protein
VQGSEVPRTKPLGLGAPSARDEAARVGRSKCCRGHKSVRAECYMGEHQGYGCHHSQAFESFVGLMEVNVMCIFDLL